MKAVLTPGQGPLAESILDRDNDSRAKWYGAAEAILGEPFTATSVRQHDINSALIVANALAHFERYTILGGVAGAVAGYSVGQLAALAIAEVISYEQAIKLAVARARIMQKHVTPATGMLSIIGFDESRIDALIDEVAREQPAEPRAVISNYNSKFNFTIGGKRGTLTRIGELAETAGAKRVLLLDVEGAWHSPFVKAAAETFAALLSDVQFAAPRIAYACNFSGRLESDPRVIRENLLGHLYCPVRWDRCIEALVASGTTHFVQCGSGNQLKQILFFMRTKPCFGTATDDEIRQCVAS